ncbi:MAG: tetratricopeptide repeat protein [Aliidongia sp.]
MLIAEKLTKSFVQAVQFYRSGQRTAAERRCREILARAPSHVQALHLLGTILLETERAAEAVTPLARAVTVQPNDAALRYLLGATYLQLDRFADAADCLEAALALKPAFAEAQCGLGVALAGQGRSDDAATAFRAALRLDPNMPQAHDNLASLLAAAGQTPQAIGHYRDVLRIEPGNAVAHHKLGLALRADGACDEAVRHFREAVRLQPSYSEARSSIGVTLAMNQRWAEALVQFEDALRAEPDSVEAHYNLGSALLLNGRLEAGWSQFEWRWRLAGMQPYRRPFPQPQWRGEDLAGRTIMLHDEQGFGDTLQFCRYAPLVARRGAKIFLEVHAELVPLLRLSFAGEAITILPRSPAFPGIDGLPACDFHSPLLSLPGVFQTGLQTIPAAIPYLRADPDKVRNWLDRLAALPRPRVGLVWAGRSTHAEDAQRSIALAQLAPLTGIPGISLLSLQKGEAGAQLATPPPGLVLHDFTGQLPDFIDTAAFLGALDLVITVDTAMAHLSGGLGKAVWLLNRCIPDWRWLLERDDSPWYPTMRQFRQSQPGDWDSVVARVAAALAVFAQTEADQPIRASIDSGGAANRAL